MKKSLINIMGGKYIYFLDVAENIKGGYIVTIGEISFNYKGELERNNVIYETDNAIDLYNFLQTGEKRGKNEN